MIKWIKKIINKIKRHINKPLELEDMMWSAYTVIMSDEEAKRIITNMGNALYLLIATDEDKKKMLTSMRDAIIEYNKE